LLNEVEFFLKEIMTKANLFSTEFHVISDCLGNIFLFGNDFANPLFTENEKSNYFLRSKTYF